MVVDVDHHRLHLLRRLLISDSPEQNLHRMDLYSLNLDSSDHVLSNLHLESYKERCSLPECVGSLNRSIVEGLVHLGVHECVDVHHADSDTRILVVTM